MTRTFTPSLSLVAVAAALNLASVAAAQGQTCYSGICFPQGDVSFADALIAYDPSYGVCPPTAPGFLLPQQALGRPDYTGGSSGTGAVSLGSGGLLQVAFVDNVLSNSGTADDDLHIFEVGPAVEASDIAVRPSDPATVARLQSAGLFDVDGDGFWEVGPIGGSVASIDLDAWAPGFGPGELLFDAVQIIDDPFSSGGCGGTAGADIDAVGAIFTSGLPPLGQPFCGSATPNSTGMTGVIEAFGSPSVSANDSFLLATSLPPDTFGYFLCSLTPSPPVMPPASSGVICLGGSIGRFNGPGEIQRTGNSGSFGLELDLTRTPQPTGFVAVTAGQTWHYQAWHRDFVGMTTTSNFTDATAVSYQ